jgi:hypothetical protein
LASAALFSITVQSQSIQSPDEFFGYPLGSYFTRHHQVVDYFKQLEKNAASSIKIEQYGKTGENRDLIVAYISSEENLKNIDKIRQQHSDLSSEEKISIVWLSYNVHGNETAGTEAAMLTAYELITQKQELLKNTLVILDPCLNPDGRDRYVNWYNQQHSSAMNVDQSSAEHNEPWPSGRPNHYLFDLNRDWAWLTQKESKQRIILYNQWLPHVHVDFHEQGINDPYYFAPAAEPFHEAITKWQREFQTGVGKNNAKYFDLNGWFYFTREIFDLLYPSYGDTYPTYSGAVGMTYEQGGSGQAGLGVLTENGDTLTLIDRLQHHHIAGLATVEYSSQQSQKLISEFQTFTKNKNYKYKSYVLGGNEDNINALRKLLDAHQIKYSFGNGATVKGFDYSKNAAGSIKATEDHLIISTDQVKGTLVNVLFEPKTKLTDSLTYDITAWSLPYAYGLEAIASESKITGTTEKVSSVKNEVVKGAYAYLADWNSMQDARFLAALLKKEIRVRYAEKPFVLNGKNYARGTMIITRGDNATNYDSELIDLANAYQIQLTPTPTGMVDSGNDFGSSSVKMVPQQNVLLVSGNSSSSLNVGEVWHFFDHQLNYPLTVVDIDNFSLETLKNFNVLIVPEGWYSAFSDETTMNSLKEWISNGGKLIAIGGAVSTFTSEKGFGLKSKSSENASTEKDEMKDPERHERAHVKYEQQEREAIKSAITGAIFKCSVEHSHPLAFGYQGDYFTLKLSADSYDWLENGSNVVYLGDKPELVAGFAGSKALPQQTKSMIFGQEDMGNGCIIYMVDNPLFRGFWENGKLFFVNAVFLTNN